MGKGWEKNIWQDCKNDAEGYTRTFEALEKLLNDKKPIIFDRAFLSTTKVHVDSSNFGNVEFKINVKKGTAVGSDITELSGHPEQKEVLLIPDQKLKILSAKKSGMWPFDLKLTIEMETVK